MLRANAVMEKVMVGPRKNPVVDDLKHVYKRVAAPIRHVVKGEDEKPELQRASGCLT